MTRAFERLNGRKALSQWLSSPPTEQMKANFKDHPLEGEEILPLVAFLQDRAVNGKEDTSPSRLIFALIGLGLAALVLVLFEWIWRDRFRGVRRPQVHGNSAGDIS